MRHQDKYYSFNSEIKLLLRMKLFLKILVAQIIVAKYMEWQRGAKMVKTLKEMWPLPKDKEQ